jgi:Type II restriction endonuclease, TdeIII
MDLSEKQTKNIKRVIRTLYESRQKRFPTEMTEMRNAPFHDIMFKAFHLQLQGWDFDPAHLASVASWIHGLNKALGDAFEIIAHILCNGRKGSFTQSDTLKISPAQADAINEVINALKRGSRKTNLQEEDQFILGSIGKDDLL